MSEQNDPRTQQRMQAVQRYRYALKRGDLLVLVAVLSEAENDAILEAMLLQVDRLAQAQEDITVPADLLRQARRFLSMLRQKELLGISSEIPADGKNPLTTVPGKNGTIQKGKGQSMLKELSPLPLDSEAKRRVTPRKTRFPHAARFLQMTAAVLIVGALIVGFLLVFSTRSGALRQTNTARSSNSPAGIYISRSDGVYRYDVQTRKVVWHTHVAGQSLFAGDPVILGDTLYIITDSWVSALDAQAGTLRWSHDFQGRVADPYLENGLLYFSTMFPLPAALYAVNPANGAITATYTPREGQKAWVAPTVVDGILYYVGNSTLYAVQLPGEKLVWQQPLRIHVLFIPPRGIIVQSGIVYVQVSQMSAPRVQSWLEVFDAHAGFQLWQSSPLAGGFAMVTVTNEMIYVSAGGQLLAFKTSTHALVWQKSLNTYGIQVVSGVLYIAYGPPGGDLIDQIIALDATTGNFLWQQSNTTGLSLVSVVNGVVYGESWSNDGKGGSVSALNASNGKLLWTMPIGVPNVQWGGIAVA